MQVLSDPLHTEPPGAGFPLPHYAPGGNPHPYLQR